MKSHRRIRHRKLNLMELLPMELLVDILKRVSAESVCRIRCVSKMLLSIVDSPSFVKLHSTLVFDPDSRVTPAPPQFILHYGLSRFYSRRENMLSSFHSLHYDPSNAQGAPQLNPRLILQSSNPTYYSLQFVFCNMFCIKYWSDHALSFLINPLRGEVLKLPPSHSIAQQIFGPYSEARDVSTGMGFDSITNTYKIVRVTDIRKRYGARCWVVQVLVLGTSEWRQTREGIQGQVHILSFDFKKEEFFWIPNPYRLPDTCCQLHLINFRGSMAIVDTTSGTTIEIWVMKDYIKKQWMLDYSISIQVLELDPQFKFSEAVCCEWEHGILFTHSSAMFLDMRGPVVTKTLVKCPIEGNSVQRHIISLHGSLISLKNFANLEEADEPATYSDWSEGVARGKNFFYLTRRH
ncbi:hypothetical protein ACLB2K_000060 [Fragaria x ananassa]